MHLYRQVRRHLRGMLQDRLANGCSRIAIYGTGEAVELAYMSLKELGLEPVAVFDHEPAGAFMGISIRGLSEHDRVAYDAMLVATFERPEPFVEALVQHGVEEGRLITLRPLDSAPGRGGGRRPARRPAREQREDV